MGKTKEKKNVLVSKESYKLRDFPDPQISNAAGKISRGQGDVIVVNLGEGFPISNVKYTVLSWSLIINNEIVSGSGKYITSADLKKAKVGSRIVLLVKCKKTDSPRIYTPETSFTVIP